MQITTYKFIYLMVLIPLNVYLIKMLIQSLRELPNMYELTIIHNETNETSQHYFSYIRITRIKIFLDDTFISWNLFNSCNNTIKSICACNEEYTFKIEKITNRQLIKCLHLLNKVKELINNVYLLSIGIKCEKFLSKHYYKRN